MEFSEIKLKNGNLLRVDFIKPAIFRIRLSKDGKLHESGLNRYGIINKDKEKFKIQTRKQAGKLIFITSDATLEINTSNGKISFSEQGGKSLLNESEPPRAGDCEDGFNIAFKLSREEKIYGLGDVSREELQRRGRKYQIIIKNVSSYIPIPFIMSTRGWGIFMNSTWFHTCDIGVSDPDILSFNAPKGYADYYIFAGKTLPILLDRYTQVTGRPVLLPVWAYGLTFVCDEREVRARDVLYEAYTFRKEDIPCDVIGMEPDWMETRYDFSVEKKWSEKRFHVPEWQKGGSPLTFSAALHNMKFKMSLWLCCDYDFSDYEEKLLSDNSPSETKSEAEADSVNYDDLFKDPNLATVYLDKYTKPGVPWFEHLKKFVDDGADAFKMDGANQVCFHPDRKWKNGMDDAEMHNLYPVLMNKHMSKGFRDHTGRRPLVYSVGGYAGIQQYSATWAGDTGGDAKPLVSLLNNGMSGNSNASCDMMSRDKRGIHFGFLQPWAQLLGWWMYTQPWFQSEGLLEIFRFYAKLRYRMLPYIYSHAHVAARTGLPIMRAMPLFSQDDPECENLMQQYMFGEFFLVSGFTDSLYLPAGNWIDFWTGEKHEGKRWIKCSCPDDRGGMLLVRDGAIIPWGKSTSHIDPKAPESIDVEVFPCGESSFTFYEDDGTTFKYLEGRVSETIFSCSLKENNISIGIGLRNGNFDGMPEHRTYNLTVHCPKIPNEIILNNKPVKDYGFDKESMRLSVSVKENNKSTTSKLKVNF